MHFPALFHTATALSGSLRSPPSPRGEGFVSSLILFLHVSCIRSDDMGIAASSYRSLPHRGRGTAPAVDRVLSQTAYLRRSFPLFFIPLVPYPARSARHLPHAGKALSVVILFLHVSYIRFDDARKAASSYRSLPHLGRRCRGNGILVSSSIPRKNDRLLRAVVFMCITCLGER